MARKNRRNDYPVVEQNLYPNDFREDKKKDCKITFTIHDMKGKLNGRTDQQKKAISAYDNGANLLLIGTAGTGKTFISLHKALESILQEEAVQKRIIIVRSAVSTREMGYLPGTEEEKMAVFEAPYVSMCDEIFKYEWRNYERLKEKKYIEFISTSHNRGSTFHDAIIIIDEVQNLNYHEIYTLLTRVGENSRVILCGDVKQSDLNSKKNDVTGLPRLIEVIKKMKSSFEIVQFTRDDIVRSKFVKDFIIADEDVPDNHTPKI